MNSESDLTTGTQLVSTSRFGQNLETLHLSPEGSSPQTLPGVEGPRTAPHPVSEIKVGKRPAVVGGKEVELFTMTMGTETIELLPLRNWGQLDLYKWRVRGKLPGTPAGLEITPDHVKLLGETVLPKDPEGCAKLERLFSEWLAMEKESVELAKKKTQLKAASATTATALPPEQQALHFQVEVDKEEQVHVHVVKGRERLATIGLNAPGFQSLVSQGLMRKPHSLKTGALHDWVEMDGVLYSFEKGNNDSTKLVAALNASYLPAASLGSGKEVVVYANAASSTGFDIQFPAKAGGVLETRRRALGEDSLELLQDPDHCGLIHKGLVIKLTRPTLIFKQKTPEGSERYLERCPAHLVRIRDEDGDEKLIDLSQPVNYMRLNAAELTAVFNHPAVNRHSQASPPSDTPIRVQLKEETSPPPPVETKASVTAPQPGSQPDPAPSKVDLCPIGSAPSSESVTSSEVLAAVIPTPDHENGSSPWITHPIVEEQNPAANKPVLDAAVPPSDSSSLPTQTAGDNGDTAAVAQPPKPESAPNLWLKPILEQQSIRFDWLACLVYGRIAARVGDSHESKLQQETCWCVQLGDVGNPADPGFQGIFLSEKGGFGFLNQGCLVRFENGAVSIGTKGPLLTGAGVRLQAVGMDVEGCFTFIVADDFKSKFNVPVSAVDDKLGQLKSHGVVLMTVKEALDSPEPLEFVWSAPAEQADPTNPQAVESTRQGGGDA